MVLCKSLESGLILLYFASKEPNVLVIFKVVLSSGSPGWLIIVSFKN